MLDLPSANFVISYNLSETRSNFHGRVSRLKRAEGLLTILFSDFDLTKAKPLAELLQVQLCLVKQ